MKGCDIAILGATGLVGQNFLEVLAQRKFPVGSIHLLASSSGAGERMEYSGKEIIVQNVEGFDFSQVSLAFFSAGASVSSRYAPEATENGCLVIDNTSEFRNEDDVPLVVPEVNPHRIADYRERMIIANPNCSTIQLVVALKPLHDAACITILLVIKR